MKDSYMKNFRGIKIVSYAFVLIYVLVACNKEDETTVTDTLSSENDIISFVVEKNGLTKELDIANGSITGLIPYSIGLTDIFINVAISPNATLSPDPSSITSLENPTNFIVTAENGAKKTYTVSVEKELNTENEILSFRVESQNYILQGVIDSNTNSISNRIPSFTNASNSTLVAEISPGATIEPSPETITDYSSPIVFTVTSESGLTRPYEVIFSTMQTSVIEICEETNASKWFGGDNRKEVGGITFFPRNVGTGQILVFDHDIHLDNFGIPLGNEFVYRDTDTPYNQAVTIKLNIRKEQGQILYVQSTEVPADFDGGWVDFDLIDKNVVLSKDATYIFTWYLVNGEELGVTSSSLAFNKALSGICGGTGYSGQSELAKNESLQQWARWYPHEWNFNFKLSGKK